MPEEDFYARNIEEAIQKLIPYLDTRTAHKAIYFDGWFGMAASMVLRSIAEHPPPSLTKMFTKIIHVDCSMWKSRRALQRTIAVKLMLPQEIMAILDRQDDEDDFIGVDEGSRSEIADVGAQIHRALLEDTCLVVFHNGSKEVIDMNDMGIPESKWLKSKILWTFRGRFRLITAEMRDMVLESHLYLYCSYPSMMTLSGPGMPGQVEDLRALLQAEVREIARYTHTSGINEEVATECCFYLLLLNRRNGYNIDYNWATHAVNYWVCDGIIEEGQEEKAWEIGAALHKELQLADYSSDESKIHGEGRTVLALEFFHYEEELVTRPNRWLSNALDWPEDQGVVPTVEPESSSFFLAFDSEINGSLPYNTFEHSVNLGVLKLCHCNFSFSVPPFHTCRSLRFLGLHSCTDQQEQEEENKEKPVVLKCFQSLRVLDICYTDWDMTSSPETIEYLAAVVREIHIEKGRIWSSSLAWQQMRNLHKLRVIEPTCPWETGNMDEFSDMIKLELLDLSRNSTIHVLPSLSDATNLKTLILDGCVGLEHVGPHGLPQALEYFSFDAGSGENNNEAKISKISLIGCKNLDKFILCGTFRNLEELDLSGASIKILNLSEKLVQLPRLERLVLLGCKQLCAIVWWDSWKERKMKRLCIDTHGEEERELLPCSEYSSAISIRYENYDGYAVLRDVRLVQSLMHCPIMRNLYITLRKPGSSSKAKGRRIGSNEHLGRHWPAMFDNPCYGDILLEGANVNDDSSDIPRPVPLARHVEISEGISLSDVGSKRATMESLMYSIDSLDVHDNSCITNLISPEQVTDEEDSTFTYYYDDNLKWCRIERCSMLQAAFMYTGKRIFHAFVKLETILVADLLTARCIWGKGIIPRNYNTSGTPLGNLQRVHLHSCPRLQFVLPMSTVINLPSLEILDIIHCGELTHIFPFESSDDQSAAGENAIIKEFPKLKRVHLHHLPKLQKVCEFRMSAPALETIKVRNCWSLRRLPVTADRRPRPVVDCEKDWWEKLEWDGLEAGHHGSLFNPHHSRYYKKALLRATVLR